MSDLTVKEEVIRLVRGLPDDATWEDVEYLVYVRKAIADGRRSAREEPTFTVNEVRARFGLQPLP